MRALVVKAVLTEPPPFFEPLEEPVVRTIAVREDQTLEQLHEALRLAFGWADPHLYSFWLGGQHWDPEAPEYTAPFEVEERGKNKLSARAAIGDLRLTKGSKLAYLFDFGDEWRLDSHRLDCARAEDQRCEGGQRANRVHAVAHRVGAHRHRGGYTRRRTRRLTAVGVEPRKEC